MHNLTHFIFDCDELDSSAIMKELLSKSSLVTLEFLQTPLSSFQDTYQFPKTLQRIVIKAASIIRQDGGIGINHAASDSTNYDMMEKEWYRATGKKGVHYGIGYRDTDTDSAAMLMFDLLQSAFQTIQHLEVAARLFSRFPETLLELPHLRILVLYGEACVGQPFLPLLRGLPSLEDLQFLLCQDDGGGGGFLLGPYPYRGEPITEHLASAHPLLHSIRLSNASPRDPIFFLLPSSVRRLSLPQVGEGDERMGWVPREEDLLEIVQSISRSQASLTEFNITIHEVPSVSFIQQIAILLPQLHTLTITRPHLAFDFYQHEEVNRLPT